MVNVILNIDTKYGATQLKHDVKLGPVIKWLKEHGTWFIHEHSPCKKQSE